MSIRGKKVGLLLPHWERGLGRETPACSDIVGLAKCADDSGFDSVWLVDHFLIEPYVDEAEYGDPLPEHRKGVKVGVWECWTLAAALAVATERVEIGTLVSNTGYRNPALLAQMMNTIDDLSQGRLIAGLGAGDYPAEHKAFGYPYERRVGRFEEALQIIPPLLRGEKVTFQGEFYETFDAELRPKYSRVPPILIGLLKGGPRMKRLVAQYADQWNCWVVEDTRIELYRESHDAIVQACEKHGRDPAALRKNAAIGVCLPGFTPEYQGETRLSGSTEEIAEQFGKFLEQDVDHLVVSLRPFSRDGIENFAELLQRV
ncbi:MAG: LLM class flavin-dependent oxidoreductase [Gammaproteobacteria bacterium]|nr:LLM class flavin-dependent oxidoreductase [Gammaproteobacteria bacterium]